MTLPNPPILVITDRSQCAEPLERRAEALFRGGCRWLSLREKDLPRSERRVLLGQLIAAATPYGATVGVHDDLPLAAELGCALHLPAGANGKAARHLLGPARLIGQSCHDAAELAAAQADYVTLSPVFPSASKLGYSPVEDLAALARRSQIPALALGGITLATLPALSPAFAGIAIMTEAMRTAEPEAWFVRLAASFD